MARYPTAQWRPISVNYSKVSIAPRFLGVHGMQGTLSGTDSWFRNPAASASAHFGIGKTGTIYQWVDTAYKAWHVASGNSIAIGVEMEMYQGEALTAAQVEALAALFAWVHRVYPAVPLRTASGPAAAGLIGHSQGGAAWGGHQDPGPRVLAQFPEIITRAGGKTVPPQSLLLRQGDTGPAVAYLQKRLNVWGAKLVEDGDFGPLTLAAVQAFQRAHSLDVDGIVGPKTWGALDKTPPTPDAHWTFGPLRELRVLAAVMTAAAIRLTSPSAYLGTPPANRPGIAYYDLAVRIGGRTIARHKIPKGTPTQLYQVNQLPQGTAGEFWVRACLPDGSHAAPWTKAAFRTLG